MRVFILIFAAILLFRFFLIKKEERAEKQQVLSCFRSGNVIVAGTKGSGKDLLFWWVISQRQKKNEPHAANIRFNSKTRVRPINAYALHNNTIENFIRGEFNKEEKTFNEREDYYISDVGIAMPGWAHTTLEKKYKTFPLVYALSRHLADFSIHCNEQEFGRVWDKLRGQAQWYIFMEKTRVRFGRARQTMVIYSRYQTAVEAVQPFKVRRNLLGIRNRDDLSYAHTFNSKYGLVKRVQITFRVPKKGSKDVYDTREFHYKLFGYRAPDVSGSNKRRKALALARKKRSDIRTYRDNSTKPDESVPLNDTPPAPMHVAKPAKRQKVEKHNRPPAHVKIKDT